MYNFEVSKELQTKLKKLFKKDRALHEQVMKEIKEIVKLAIKGCETVYQEQRSALKRKYMAESALEV